MGFYEVVYLVSSMLGTYARYRLFHIFYDVKRPNYMNEFIIFFVQYLIIAVIYLKLDIPIVVMFANILTMVFIGMYYKKDIKKSILVTVALFAIMITIEAIIMTIIGGIINISTLVSEGVYSSVFAVVSVNVITYIVSLGSSKFRNIKSDEDMSISYWGALIFIPVSTLFLTIVITFDGMKTPIIITLSAVCVVALNFIMFSLYNKLATSFKRSVEELKIKEVNRSYINQLELMKSSMNKTSAIQHDMNRHLSMLDTMVKNEEYTKVTKYVKNMIIDNKKEENIVKTGNLTIDSIINFELLNAREKNIDIEVMVDVLPNSIAVQDYDLTIIISNLLKNAVYATQLISENRRIRFTINYDKGVLYIRVINNYDGKVVYEGARIGTRKVDKNNHGYGLINIERTVDKYNGDVVIKHDHKEFFVEVVLFAKPV